MRFFVKYACVCFQGLVRTNNEDNFVCHGLYQPKIHEDFCMSGSVKTETRSVFAVFDGMGGEQAGETASYMAAKELQKQCVGNNKLNDNQTAYIEDLCQKLNRKVCGYAKENKISSMGTTLAGIIFGKNGVLGFNLGDSRIFRFKNGKLIQISVDHVSKSTLFRKAPLTQFLGIPEDEMKLSPYVWSEECEDDVRYLICTDGLTDMLSEMDIQKVLSEERSMGLCVEKLREEVLEKGAVDNTTIILCEIKKKPALFAAFRK